MARLRRDGQPRKKARSGKSRHEQGAGSSYSEEDARRYMEAISTIRTRIREVVARYNQRGDRLTAAYLIGALLDPDGSLENDKGVTDARRVVQFAVDAAVSGRKEDRALLARFAKELSGKTRLRALAVWIADDAIQLYHASHATPRQRDDAVRMLLHWLPSLCDSRFRQMSADSARKHLHRADPGARVGSGAGHIAAPGLMAALSVEVGAFDDCRREDGARREVLSETRTRVAKAFRKAVSLHSRDGQ